MVIASADLETIFKTRRQRKGECLQYLIAG
jgi:hypothetical protein